MDQTRYTLLALIATLLLTITSGFASQWYSKGARPMGSISALTRQVLVETKTAITLTSDLLPTPQSKQTSISAGVSAATRTPAPTIDPKQALLNQSRMWSLVLYDPFDRPANGWDVNNEVGLLTGNRIILNGEYTWRFETSEGFAWESTIRRAEFPTFNLSVQFKKENASESSVGLVFRSTNDNNYFLFSLCADTASYAVWSRARGKWNSIIPCTKVSHSSATETNQLSVVADDNEYNLYINGEHAGYFEDDTHTMGTVGVYVSSSDNTSNTVTFDNFILRAPLEK